MAKTIRWGILGTGAIANKFAVGLNHLPGTELVAVGSRSAETARTFGERFSVPRRHSSYQGLADDPEVDIVYVSTPHPFHLENTLLCLGAGKAVLCEKPFAMNAAEVGRAIHFARERGLFLMEAMWTRFLPHMMRVRELLAEGAVGELRMLQVNFGFRAEVEPQSRLFDPALGGGALLDVGVYSVALAHMLFGPPTEVAGFANLGSTGVDEEAALIFHHNEGQLSLLATAIRLDTPHEATLIGTDGWIQIHRSWWNSANFTLHRSGCDPELFEIPCPLNGYNYQVLAINKHLRAGGLESNIMPLDDTLAITETMDRLRDRWGLKYPGE